MARNKFVHYVSVALNIFAVAILMLMLFWVFAGVWGFMLITGWYEYGEGAKLTTKIIYYISYFCIAFAPIEILIATFVSIFLRKKEKIVLSILVQVLTFIVLFFAVILQNYLI